MSNALVVDARNGAAGDMFIAALVDLGADLAIAQRAVDVVYPNLITFKEEEVTRAGARATYVKVEENRNQQAERTWQQIEEKILESQLSHRVKKFAYQIFFALAEAEAAVHKVDIKDVHFHEVGSADSIADIIGVAALLDSLDVSAIFCSNVEVGSGSVQTSHGVLPVPTPATSELLRGFRFTSKLKGECLTPTGAAILTTFARAQNSELTVGEWGHGAGTRNPEDYSNILRVSIISNVDETEQLVLETNIDDSDPRLIPVVIEKLMAAGARDAWAEPIQMKKNRPGFTIKVLCTSEDQKRLGEILSQETSSIGYRVHDVSKVVLERIFRKIEVRGVEIAFKISSLEGLITHISPEFDEVRALADGLNIPTRVLMEEARFAAERAGYRYGAKINE